MSVKSTRPRRPTGNSAEAQFAKWVWDALVSLEITSSKGCKVTRTSQGTTIAVEAQNGTSQGDSEWFGGEYNMASLSSVKKNKLYIVTTGDNKGSYVSTEDNPTMHPWEGGQWVQLPTTPQSTYWT